MMSRPVGLAKKNHRAIPIVFLDQVLCGGGLSADYVDDLLKREVRAPLIDFRDRKRSDWVAAYGRVEFIVKRLRIHASRIELRTAAAQAGRVEPAEHNAAHGLRRICTRNRDRDYAPARIAKQLPK